MKIVTVVGARPQFVKAQPLLAALRAAGAASIVVHTGQHYDYQMSGAFFDELGIPAPDLNLEVGSGSHSAQTAEMMKRFEPVVARERPDWVVVLGDTNSTLAGALVAAKAGVRLAHVEAGLRSFDRAMPEEVNRVLTDHVSQLLACPSPVAVENLRREGITRGVIVTGDLMFDALKAALVRLDGVPSPAVALGQATGAFALATIHRAAATDTADGLRAVLGCLAAVPMPVVFPAHPRTAARMRSFHLELPANVIAIEPVSYLNMVALQRDAAVVLTDSGGVQKEAFWLGVPCITLRDSTEWVETVELGRNVLVGFDAAKVRSAIGPSRRWTQSPDCYGSGIAAGRIVAALQSVQAIEDSRPAAKSARQ